MVYRLWHEAENHLYKDKMAGPRVLKATVNSLVSAS